MTYAIDLRAAKSYAKFANSENMILTDLFRKFGSWSLCDVTQKYCLKNYSSVTPTFPDRIWKTFIDTL